MIEFLFGWLYKGAYDISFLDGVMATVEVVIVFLIVIWLSVEIDKIKNRKE